jgi:Holliday junction resolvase
MINSKRKGKTGELELSAFLREHGFEEARRGVQYKGGEDSPDVVGVPGCHLECKRAEKGNLYDWLEQAERDAKPGQIPIVAHRRNRKKWVAILSLEELLVLVLKARL